MCHTNHYSYHKILDNVLPGIGVIWGGEAEGVQLPSLFFNNIALNSITLNLIVKQILLGLNVA